MLRLRLDKKNVVQQIQFVEDDKNDANNDEMASDCSFFDKSLEKIINEEKKIIENISNTFDSTKEWTLSHFNNLPEWLQDNEYLHFGHRPPLNSFSACFLSIFKVHTETGNIYSHMLGCFLFLLFAVYFIGFSDFSENLTLKDKFVFGLYFLSVILCLGFSFLFHTLSCHSRAISKLFSKLDYLGITLLISGSFVSCFYFMFYCNAKLQTFYLSFVFLFSLMTSAVCLFEKFSEPKYRTIRAIMFLLFGCSGVVPVLHYISIHTDSVFQNLKFGFMYLSLMGFFYIAGAVLYAGRVPERFIPGKCDYLFQSHQIFHLLVNLSAFFHYLGLREFSLNVTRNQCRI